MSHITKWDDRFLRLAKFVSEWSLDPSTKVGSVIVDDKNRVLSVGFNGLPRGIEDSPERLNNREIKYKMVVHAERNALIFAERPLTDCTIYTWPFQPCTACSSMIIQAGITRIVSLTNETERWQDDFNLATEILNEAEVDLDLFDPELYRALPPAVVTPSALMPEGKKRGFWSSWW